MKPVCVNEWSDPELEEPPYVPPPPVRPVRDQSPEEHEQYCAGCIDFYGRRYLAVLHAKGIATADKDLHDCPLHELDKETRAAIFRLAKDIKIFHCTNS